MYNFLGSKVTESSDRFYKTVTSEVNSKRTNNRNFYCFKKGRLQKQRHLEKDAFYVII
ncbi:MAG: hypothetical protein ACTHM5_05785 [Ginsengibacter sp.]